MIWKIGEPSSKPKYNPVIDSEKYREGKVKKGLNKTMKNETKLLTRNYSILNNVIMCILHNAPTS
jgi:hypothetical protein